MSKRKDKRGRMQRRKHSETPKSTAPGGGCLVGLWAVSVLFGGLAYFNYRFQLGQKGYAHLPVVWLVIPAVLMLTAIAVTVQWFGRRSQTRRRDKPK